MEHAFSPEIFQRENRTTFLKFQLFPGTFQWYAQKTCVPLTSHLEFSEFLSKWKAPHITHRRNQRLRSPVSAHAQNFDFCSYCRKIKRCEESKRTLKIRLHRVWPSSILHQSFSKLQSFDILFPLSFDLGEIGIFWRYLHCR